MYLIFLMFFKSHIISYLPLIFSIVFFSFFLSFLLLFFCLSFLHSFLFSFFHSFFLSFLSCFFSVLSKVIKEAAMFLAFSNHLFSYYTLTSILWSYSHNLIKSFWRAYSLFLTYGSYSFSWLGVKSCKLKNT